MSIQRKEITKFVRNESKDGWMPVCPNCNEPYADAAYGEIKNYPDDGVLAIFMMCDRCGGEETGEYSLAWKPPKKQP